MVFRYFGGYGSTYICFINNWTMTQIKNRKEDTKNPGLVPAIIQLLHPEPQKNNRPPRKVRYFSPLVQILRPHTEALVGVLKSEVGILTYNPSIVTGIS